MSVEERARRIQRDVEHHAKELDAMDDRSTVYPELMSYGPYIALVFHGSLRLVVGVSKAARLPRPGWFLYERVASRRDLCL